MLACARQVLYHQDTCSSVVTCLRMVGPMPATQSGLELGVLPYHVQAPGFDLQHHKEKKVELEVKTVIFKKE